MVEDNCFLSGLVIPTGTRSIDHLAPKSKVPYKVANDPYNLVPTITIFNIIKSDRFYCQWMDYKYNLVDNAYKRWNIRLADKALLIKAIHRGMPERDPCEFCICKNNFDLCINKARLEQRLKNY